MAADDRLLPEREVCVQVFARPQGDAGVRIGHVLGDRQIGVEACVHEDELIGFEQDLRSPHEVEMVRRHVEIAGARYVVRDRGEPTVHPPEDEVSPARLDVVEHHLVVVAPEERACGSLAGFRA